MSRKNECNIMISRVHIRVTVDHVCVGLAQAHPNNFRKVLLITEYHSIYPNIIAIIKQIMVTVQASQSTGDGTRVANQKYDWAPAYHVYSCQRLGGWVNNASMHILLKTRCCL